MLRLLSVYGLNFEYKLIWSDILFHGETNLTYIIYCGKMGLTQALDF